MFDPLWASGWLIASHAVAAILALGVGAVQLIGPKGTTLHRALGYVWVGAIAFVAFGSFGIHTIRMIGPFSPIHILSVITLLGLWRAVTLARAGEISRHRRAMRQLYLLALVVTGLFTLWPGRVMHQVLFGT